MSVADILRRLEITEAEFLELLSLERRPYEWQGDRIKFSACVTFDRSIEGESNRRIWVVQITGTGDMGAVIFPVERAIKRVTMLGHGGASGSCVVDLRRTTYDLYSTTVPAAGDSICGSAKPTISAAYKSQDGVLSGWKPVCPRMSVVQAYCESFATFSSVEMHVEHE